MTMLTFLRRPHILLDGFPLFITSNTVTGFQYIKQVDAVFKTCFLGSEWCNYDTYQQGANASLC